MTQVLPVSIRGASHWAGLLNADAQAAFLAALGIDELDEPRRELHRALDELF